MEIMTKEIESDSYVRIIPISQDQLAKNVN